MYIYIYIYIHIVPAREARGLPEACDMLVPGLLQAIDNEYPSKLPVAH